MTREEAARKFAEVMGWECEHGHWTVGVGVGELVVTAFYRVIDAEGHVEPEDEIELPPADAPLHEHLAFVGRVAEALSPWTLSVIYAHERAGTWHVGFHRRPGHLITGPEASDPSWAAMLAAIEAKGATP